MTEMISGELREVGLMIVAGVVVMTVFHTGTAVTGRLSPGRRGEGAISIITWICVAFIFCEFLYEASFGVLRWYDAAAFGAGIFLWKKLIYDIIFRTIGLNTKGKEESGYEKEKKI